MTPLGQHMTEDMQIHNLSQPTQSTYVMTGPYSKPQGH